MEVIIRKVFQNQELQSIELIGVYPDDSKDAGKKIHSMYTKAKERYNPKKFAKDGKFLSFTYYTFLNVVSVERYKVKEIKTKINFASLC